MQEFLSLLTPCINNVFGPENRHCQILGPDPGGVWESTWGNRLFFKKKKVNFCIIRKVAQNGRNSAKTDFKQSKVPPRGAS